MWSEQACGCESGRQAVFLWRHCAFAAQSRLSFSLTHRTSSLYVRAQRLRIVLLCAGQRTDSWRAEDSLLGLKAHTDMHPAQKVSSTLTVSHSVLLHTGGGQQLFALRLPEGSQ